MALRLIELVVQDKSADKITELLKNYSVLEHRQFKLQSGEILVRILLDAEKSEPVLDLLDKHNVGDGSKMVVLPVEAAVPRAVSEQESSVAPVVQNGGSERVSREELYENIKNAAKCSTFYILMVFLSTIVAVVGLYRDSVTIIIGAMMIAPLLGPNMALAIGATLGDLPLLWRAFRTSLAGIVVTVIISLVVGFFLTIDPNISEVASRISVLRIGDIILALVAGCAGALAFMSGGISIELIGVMVAVALLPPLVIFGLLAGGGKFALAVNPLLLFSVNLVGVILSGVITFLSNGIHPTRWREKNRAENASHIIIGLSLVLLIVALIIILFWRRQ